MLANAEVADRARPTTALVGLGVTFWAATILQSLVFYSTGRTGKVGLVTAAAAILNLGLNFALIPKLGVLGAGMATAVSYAGAFGLMTFLARGETAVRYDLAFTAKAAAAALTAAVPAFLLSRLGHPLLGAVAGGLSYLPLFGFGALDAATRSQVRKWVASLTSRNR
jgi:O-antigen/teichoic acid export membrane protein